ncbi:response regulator [Sansalvadorimonas verongulae]
MSLLALLVEDDRDLSASVADYLALNQISVDHAYNGQAGLNLALENRYDVLLIDLMMPRMDGLTLCKKAGLCWKP